MKKIDTAGRVLLPKEAREKVGITADSELEILVNNNNIIIRPMEEVYTLKKNEMELIREVYKFVRDAMLLDDNKLIELKEICGYTDVKCPNCGEDMFVTPDKTYKCDNCK